LVPHIASSHRTSRRKLAIISFFSLIIFAVSVTITPPSLQSIAKTFKISFSQAGALFGASFFGYFIGVSLGGFISDRLGRRVLVLGMFSLAISLLFFGLSPYYWMLLFFIWFIGASGGLIEGVASALIGDLYPERKGYSLNLSQVFFGIGAFAGPLIPGYLLSFNLNWRISYITISLVTFVLFGLFLRVEFPSLSYIEKPYSGKILKLFKSKEFLLLSICMALYGAAEVGLTSWIPVYVQENVSSSVILSSVVLSLFWGGIIGGRLFTSWLSDKVSYRRLILFSAGFGMLSVLMAILFTNITMILFFFAITGFSLSGIWPTLLACAGDVFPAYLGTVFGVLISIGAIGAAIYPWVIGIFIELIGIRYGMCTIAILLLGITGLSLRIMK